MAKKPATKPAAAPAKKPVAAKKAVVAKKAAARPAAKPVATSPTPAAAAAPRRQTYTPQPIESSEVRWVDPADLQGFHFVEGDIQVLPDLVRDLVARAV